MCRLLTAFIFTSAYFAKSSTTMPEFLKQNQVFYDPSVDPENLEQYLPKDYTAIPMYQKIPNHEITENKQGQQSGEAEFPPPPPPYNFDSKLPVIEHQFSEDVTPSHKNKSFKFLLHLLVFLLVLITILSVSLTSCDGNKSSRMMDNNQFDTDELDGMSSMMKSMDSFE